MQPVSFDQLICDEEYAGDTCKQVKLLKGRVSSRFTRLAQLLKTGEAKPFDKLRVNCPSCIAIRPLLVTNEMNKVTD